LALVLIAVLCGTSSAGADLYRATKQYQEGNYANALQEFLTLAKLGQPVAQYDVAVMYSKGQGATQSDIHAYAWATLAAANGEAVAKKLADHTRPLLAPGSERVAGWITAPYTPRALEQRLLPLASTNSAAVRQWKSRDEECYPRSIATRVYPRSANNRGTQGAVFAEYTLMPDGTSRLPRIVLAIPEGAKFADATRKSILYSTYAPLAPGSRPIGCANYYKFTNGALPQDYMGLIGYEGKAKRNAEAGDPMAQLMYGMMLVGLPQLRGNAGSGLTWFVKAAQAGLPLAQYEVGFSLLKGNGCAKDDVKALRWLHMAASQNEPHAEVELALRSLHGSATPQQLARAQRWLESAAAQGDEDGELFLAALLATAPSAQVRDPTRALEVLRKIFSEVRDDPTAYEIRAAAEAAQGHFERATDTELEAIKQAKWLHWSVLPLEQRLASYRAGKPWYGNLLAF
jgi:TPR repeat protein